MKENFDKSLSYVLRSEGGYVNDPRDPGGATNCGITQKQYDAWRRSHNLPSRAVRDITDLEVEAIYHKLYWDRVAGDSLPAGLDYAIFDFAINSGPARAVKFIQRIVGVVEDGEIGPKTLKAISSHSAESLINDLCDSRQRFVESLSTFKYFGRGWTIRIRKVRERALAML